MDLDYLERTLKRAIGPKGSEKRRKHLSNGKISNFTFHSNDGSEQKYEISVVDGIALLRDGVSVLCSSPFVYWDKNDEDYFNAVSKGTIFSEEEIMNSYFDRFIKAGLY